MKKTLYLMMAFVIALAFAVPALAANPTSGRTEISTTVGETYTITIPDQKTIGFEDESTSLGNIGLATAHITPGKQVTFTASVGGTGLGTMKNRTDAGATLAYTLKIDGTATNTVSFSAVGEKEMTVEITAAAWAAARAGDYADTITFTVACENILT